MSRRSRALVLVLATIAISSCTQARPTARDAQPVPGGTLVVSVRDLGTLDPAFASGRGALLAVSQVFDSLTAIDPATNELRPAAAASWTSSKDGLTWTFTLDDRRYHDGTPVIAKDFEFAFDRIARKATRSDAAFQLEQVKGFRAAHVAGTARTLAGVSAPRDDTLVVTLERPFAELPYVLAHPSLAPIPARLYAKSAAALRAQPVGNGPFKVVDAAAEEKASMIRNDSYPTTPFLDAVEFRVERTAGEGWRDFLEGKADVADVPATALEIARARGGADGFSPQWATLSFGPNLKRSTYAKPEVRRALSLAIDRSAIANTVYARTKDVATGILPRGIRGYVPDACTACVLDRERAKQILDAAFPSQKPEIVVDHLSDQTSRQVARTIANDLTLVGLRAKLRAHAPVEYRKLLQAGKHDLAQLGWLADVPTPDGFLAQQLRTGSPNNQTAFKDATFDKLLDRARATANDAERLALYREAEKRALDLMPLIPVVFFRNRTAVAEHVRGFTLDGAGLFDAATVWLAQR